MNPLVPCPACSRHVRSSEKACPFCTAALPAGLAARAVPAAPRRLERLAAFTFASTMAVVACSGSSDPGVQEEDMGAVQPLYGLPPPPHDAGKDSSVKDGGGRDARPDARDAGGHDARPDAKPDAKADAGPCDPLKDDAGAIGALYGLPPPCPDPDEFDGGGIVPLYGKPVDGP